MGASSQVALDLLEQRDGDAQQERPIWRAYLHSVVANALTSVPDSFSQSISLGDPEVAQSIRINHSAKFLLDKPGMLRHFCIAGVDSLQFRCKEADQAAADGWNIGAKGLPARERDHGQLATDPAR